jgi:hypothetical protein
MPCERKPSLWWKNNKIRGLTSELNFCSDIFLAVYLTVMRFTKKQKLKILHKFITF